MRLADNRHLDGLTYRGWTLSAVLERDDDVQRWEYEASNGPRSVTLDWSAYHTFKPRDFEAMVDSGFPRRFGIGPLCPCRC